MFTSTYVICMCYITYVQPEILPIWRKTPNNQYACIDFMSVLNFLVTFCPTSTTSLSWVHGIPVHSKELPFLPLKGDNKQIVKTWLFSKVLPRTNLAKFRGRHLFLTGPHFVYVVSNDRLKKYIIQWCPLCYHRWVVLF